MDNSTNGKNGHRNGEIPLARRRPNAGLPARRYGRPSYPFYGIYSKRGVLPLLIQRKRQRHQKKNPSWVIYALIGIMGGLAVSFVLALVLVMGAGFGVATYTYNYYASGLTLDKEYALAFETSRIYDRNGVLLYEKLPAEGARDYVQISSVPKVLIDATVATEDPTFYENQGFDLYAVMRAAFINLSGQGSSGASTITQQVARLLYLPPKERVKTTYDRKIKEIILSTMLTEKFSKDQILEKYLNNIYYGNLAYGIEAAAQGYFGKSAKDLNLAEASMLAGLPQLPSQYDPTINYDLARQRQRRVLELMVKYEKISETEAQEAYAISLKEHLQDRRKKSSTMKAPHWVNYILAEFSSETGLKQLADAGLLITQEDWEQGGFDIYTSIDLRLVDEAEAAARKRIEDLKKQKASNAALVAMRPNTGEILSMIGSVDFSSKEINGQFNAALAYRQPGSSIKPITYAAAMTKGWTAATVIADTQTTFPGANGRGYTPPNPNGRFMGPIAVRMALGSSLNVPAVKTLQFAGIQYMMDLAKDMGVNYQKTADYYGLALTLGGGEVRLVELTSAYTVFANMGNKVDPVSVLKVVRRGETLYEFNPANVKRKQIISPQIAYVLTDILSDNRARLLVFSAQNPLILNRPAAAKTGTTDDFKDSWTVGYTPDLTVGVWIGNNDNSPMLSVAGGIGGGYVWNDFMNRVYGSPELMKAIQMGDTPLQRDFVKPEGVVRVEVCEESGLLPNDKPEFECPKKYTELFPANNVPRQKSTLHQKVKIPRLQLAPDQTPPPATTTTPGSSGIGINDPRYCIAGDTYPPDQVEERMFYNYPPELKEWGIRNGRVPPPTQQCSNYVPPTPTPQPSPTVDPNLPPDLTNPAGPGSTPGVTTTPDQKRTPIPILTNPAPFLTSQPTSAAPKPTPTPGRPATTFPPTPTRNS